MLPIGTTSQLRSLPTVTISLIIINAIVFVIEITLFTRIETSSLLLYLINLFSVFIHADFFHLFGNMLFLWIFGSHLENKIGSKRFFLYYFICEIGASIFHLVADGRPAIGASGAISGVMGIYLFRCHYSKIKTLVPVFFFFIKANINAQWLLLYWILRDVYDSFFTVDDVAYWAHIGGYSTGILIGIINNYWSESKVEHLYERATDSIRIRWGLSKAEEDLLNVLKIDPDNAEANLELARYYSENMEKKEKGKKYYLAAERDYYIKKNDRYTAGEVFLECLEKYSEPMEPVRHLKYANALSSALNWQGASKILEPLIYKSVLKGALGEQIFFNYINFSIKAKLINDAQYAYEKFKESFPDSPLMKKAESLIRSYSPRVKKEIPIVKAESSNSWILKIRQNISEVTSDWLFWFLVLVQINIFVYIDFLFIFPIALLIAFSVTLVARNHVSFLESLFRGRYKSEKEGLREYNVNFFKDKALVCEREERYDDAIKYLQASIKEEKDIENIIGIRYRIARLYHKKLGQPKKAINEYKILSNIAPKDHPFRRDAYEGIKELSQLIPSPIS